MHLTIQTTYWNSHTNTSITGSKFLLPSVCYSAHFTQCVLFSPFYPVCVIQPISNRRSWHLTTISYARSVLSLSGTTPQFRPPNTSTRPLHQFPSSTLVFQPSLSHICVPHSLLRNHLTESLPPIFAEPSGNVKVRALQGFTSSDLNRRLIHLALEASTAFITSGSLRNVYNTPLYLVCHIPLSLIGPDIFPSEP